DLSGDPAFLTLLEQMRQTSLDAYTHQDVPFEHLAEALKPERGVSSPPLFQVMFTLQNAPMQNLALENVSITLLPPAVISAKFDINLWLEETAQGLEGACEYNADLFNASTVQRMLGNFYMLLKGIVANPEQPISRLPLLNEAERRQLLEEWNDTQASYPKDKCLHQLIEEQAAKTPDAAAVVFEGEELTYAALNARANQLAHYLTALGIGPDVLAGVCMERSLEMVLGLLGVLKAGGAYVPIDPNYPRERVAYVLEDANAPVLLTQASLKDSFTGTKARKLCLDTDWEKIARESRENPDSSVNPDNLAYVIYTSGSTGKPKGVQISHQAFVNFLISMAKQPGLNDKDILLAVTTISFDICGLEFFLPLITGARFIIVRRETAADGRQIAEELHKCEATVLQATPATWRMVAPELPDNSSLKGLCGGEALPAALADELLEKGVELWNVYGPTETTVWSSVDNVTTQSEKNVPGSEKASVPIGYPIANTQLYILDKNLQPVPVGVPGELHIGGDGLARGYLNRLELTAEKFIPDPFSSAPDARLYKTGDLCRYLADGNIEYLRRIDFQIKIRGLRVELGEIETAIVQHEAVQQTVVIVREDQPGDKRLAAYIVSKPEQLPTSTELRAMLKEKLPDYMVPAAFVMLDKIPLTPNGKVDRRALPLPDMVAEAGKDYIAPRSRVEKQLAGIWGEILGVRKVGIKDNFFELGGHSLLATQVTSQIRETFSVEVPLRLLFESPAIAGFSKYIETAQREQQLSSAPSIESISREGELPLSHAQQRLWFLEQMEGETAAYNVPLALRFNGALVPDVLQRSLREIVRRHESLRTVFPSTDGEPLQRIAAELNPPLPVTDLQSLSGDQQAAEVCRLALQEAEHRFDLAEGPLLRTGLLRLNAEEHILFLTMHHIISDGWSIGVFLRELGALYEAYAADKPSPLPDLPIQYVDFAHWQRQWLSGGELAKQLDYWKKQLAGTPALLELPTDRPRPPVQTFHGKVEYMHIDAELTGALNQLSQTAGGTLFMTLLAAFMVLLHRYTGQEDIPVGSPIASRTRRELEGLIGFFVNTLVLRADLSGDPTFLTLLEQMRQISLDAYAHQDVPFEHLVEALKPERSISYPPLFQVMFSLQNAPMENLALENVSITFLPPAIVSAKFDINLWLEETAQGLEGTCEYNTDLFDASTVQRMLGHFHVLLKGIVANPEQPLSRLPLLNEAERHQLLVEWNDTQVDYPLEKCIHQLVEEQAAKTPDAVA
ncbi:MAG: amino acid adenylation domain-containing protein, partial [Gammaproteobacteria bacterium]|nr:amino acid adenylation domain-containing protein [Gammaproteobacteria bacterium]